MIQKQYLQQFIDHLYSRNFSSKTIRSYSGCLRQYFEFDSNFCVFNSGKITTFLAKKKKEGLSGSSLNLYLASIKYFYRNILNSKFRMKLRYAKKPKILPVVLSRTDLDAIFEVTTNRKHRLMMQLAYGAGLRISEVVNLQVQSLDFRAGLLKIVRGKGAKDRVTLLPESLNSSLQVYIQHKDPSDYVFESERGGKLSTRTLQVVFLRAKNKVLKNSSATFHSLRHSFATHLIENGVNLRFVQELLGHSSVMTTMRYTHVTTSSLQKIKSPL